MSAFLETIPDYLRDKITVFCTDMWEGYITSLEEFIHKYSLKAKVTIDRFHVAKQYREGFDELRKKETRRLKKELSEQQYKEECKGILWLSRYNPDALKEEGTKQLEQFFTHSPLLKEAYTLRNRLTDIFEQKISPDEAKEQINLWIKQVEAASVNCFDKSIKMIQNHIDGITNYFVDRSTSGFVEGLNNKLKVIKRRCYGIKKAATLFQRIWLDLHGYARFT